MLRGRQTDEASAARPVAWMTSTGRPGAPRCADGSAGPDWFAERSATPIRGQGLGEFSGSSLVCGIASSCDTRAGPQIVATPCAGALVKRRLAKPRFRPRIRLRGRPGTGLAAGAAAAMLRSLAAVPGAGARRVQEARDGGTAVQESLERVHTVLHNSGYNWPQYRVLINRAPADIKKEGRRSICRLPWA